METNNFKSQFTGKEIDNLLNKTSKILFFEIIDFKIGEVPQEITTAQFLAKLKELGAFNYRHWTGKCKFAYASNDYITDTDCGDIDLAGAVINVYNTDSYIIEVLTAAAGRTNTMINNSVFIYRNNGSDYNPGWKRLTNSTDIEDKYLPIKGGTLLNSLKVPKIYINNGSSNGYISSNSASNIFVGFGADISTVWDNESFRPSTSQKDIITLGTINQRWANVYANTINVKSNNLVSNLNADLLDDWNAEGTTGKVLKKSGAIVSNIKGLSSYWGKLASFNVPANQENYEATLYLHSIYSLRFAILEISIRTLSTSDGYTLKLVAGNIPVENIRLYKESSNPTTFELWYNVEKQYGCIKALCLSETHRTTEEKSDFVTLYRTSITTVQTPTLNSYINPTYLTLHNNTSSANSLSPKQLTNENLDTILDTNITNYWSNADNTCINKPNGVNAFNLTPYKVANGIIHVLIDTLGDIYKRTYYENTWGDWKKIPNENDLEKLSNALDYYKNFIDTDFVRNLYYSQLQLTNYLDSDFIDNNQFLKFFTKVMIVIFNHAFRTNYNYNYYEIKVIDGNEDYEDLDTQNYKFNTIYENFSNDMNISLTIDFNYKFDNYDNVVNDKPKLIFKVTDKNDNLLFSFDGINRIGKFKYKSKYNLNLNNINDIGQA